MKPRILGRHVNLLLLSDDILVPVDLGELDEFSATSSTEIIKTRPVGYFLQGVTTKYAGYELSFKIGKTNPFIERLNYLTDKELLKGKQPPRFMILETVFHYDRLGPVPIMESWMYRGVTLYGLDVRLSGEGDYEQEIKGFATYKDTSPIDTTILNLNYIPGIGIQEVLFRIDRKNKVYKDVSEVINTILG
jgi:hypothetical protein